MSVPTIPPSPGQLQLLSFFNAHAVSKAEAHVLITNLLSMPDNKRRWIGERARRCVAAMQPSIEGQHGHDALFAVACALVHGFALAPSEAMPLMQEYNLRASPPWSDRDLEYKLRSAEKSGHDKPRGHLIGDDSPSPTRNNVGTPIHQYARPAAKINFDPEKLRALAEKWREVVNLVWMANRSVQDPANVSTVDFLKLLYGPTEKVLCFTNQKSQGQALWPKDDVPKGGVDGAWFLPQPVSGAELPNPRTGKMSRRSEESVTDFRYMVLESDEADVRDWLGFIVQVPLRIEAIYTSGGRSVHALVRVDCATKRQWDAYKAELTPMINLLCMGGLDPAVITAVRLTRLPGCWRSGKLQKLLYVRPNAPVRPLSEIPASRDVVGHWTAAAAMGVSDGEENDTRVRKIRGALDYYAPASKACRVSLAQFNQDCEKAGFDVTPLSTP